MGAPRHSEPASARRVVTSEPQWFDDARRTTPDIALTGPFLSGTLFRHLLQELEAEVGRDAVWRAVGAIPELMRAECLDSLAMRWVHASTSTTLVREVARQNGRSARELHDRIVERSAQRVFTTIWRTIFHFVSAEAMILRIPVMFRRTYQGITAHAELTGPTSAIIRVGNWPAMDDLTLHGIAVSIATGLRVVTKQTPMLTVLETEEGAEYRVSWRGTVGA